MTEFAAMKDPVGYLKPEQVSLMIDHEPNLRNKLIIRMLFRGGMRVTELCRSEVSGILWEENCLLIPWLKKRIKPGEDPPMRKIPLDQGTMDMIQNWLSHREEFHLKAKDPRIIPLDRRQVYWIVRRAAERVGILTVGSPQSPKHPHPHNLRHSYATVRARRTGGDFEKLRKVQLNLGHANINTTASYLAVSAEELHKGYDEAWEGLD